MKNIKILQLFIKRQLSTGFSLIELLAALVTTGIVVSAAGVGLMHMLYNDKSTNAQVERRTEVNRALDFISDEVRKAKTINKTTTIDALDTTSSYAGFTTTGGKTVALVLEIPDGNDADNNLENVIYYVKSNVGTSWKGPQILYRWGPKLDANGNYEITSGNLTYTEEGLIDGINNTVASANCKGSGFYVCPGGAVNNATGIDYYKTAQIYIGGEYIKPINVTENYAAKTETVSRVNPVPVANDIPSLTAAAIFDITTGGTNRSASFEVIGSSYACNSSKNWEVETIIESGSEKITLDPKTNSKTGKLNSKVNISINNGEIEIKDEASGNPLNITSNPYLNNPTEGDVQSSCNNSGANVSSIDPGTNSLNKSKVRVLKNGDPFPPTDITNINGQTYTGQKTVEEMLQPYMNGGKIKLQPNQVIYLFEIGQTDPAKQGYDLQDNLVLVTIE